VPAAINDPTTVVLAIDRLQRLLGKVGKRALRGDEIRDPGGRTRVILCTPASRICPRRPAPARIAAMPTPSPSPLLAGLAPVIAPDTRILVLGSFPAPRRWRRASITPIRATVGGFSRVSQYGYFAQYP
jgi:hypothetical protein